MKHTLQVVYTSLFCVAAAVVPANATVAYTTATEQCESAISSELASADGVNIERKSIKTRNNRIKLSFRVKQGDQKFNAYCLTSANGDVQKLDIQQ